MSDQTKIRLRVALLAVKNSSILLAKHVKGDKTYYMLPGGGVSSGETMVAALARELDEEAGVKAEGLRLQALCESIAPDESRHIVHVIFRGEHIVGEPGYTGRDSRVADVQWIPLDEFFNLPFYPNIKDYILEASEGPVGPLYREIKWLK